MMMMMMMMMMCVCVCVYVLHVCLCDVCATEATQRQRCHGNNRLV